MVGLKKKTVTNANISPKMMNPRDVAVERRRRRRTAVLLKTVSHSGREPLTWSSGKMSGFDTGIGPCSNHTSDIGALMDTLPGAELSAGTGLPGVNFL